MNSTSPALTSAPSATSTFVTVASKCDLSATLATACAVPISLTVHGTVLRSPAASVTETGGRGGAAGAAAAGGFSPVTAAGR